VEVLILAGEDEDLHRQPVAGGNGSDQSPQI